MPNAIDLFCGAGGMSEGIISAGFDIVFSSDINAQVMDTYIRRHEQLGLYQGVDTHFHLGDVKDITGNLVMKSISRLEAFQNNPSRAREIDVVFGGPPCQGFSRAGKRDSFDPRNYLFKEYVRIINEIRPKYVVMENVMGFIDTNLSGFEGIKGNIYNGTTCRAPLILRSELEGMGYTVLDPQVMDASFFGVPQKRERIVFLAFRNDVEPLQYPNAITHVPITLIDAIGDLIRDERLRHAFNPTLSRYQEASLHGRTKNSVGQCVPSPNIINNELPNHSNIVIERFSLFKQGEKSIDFRKRIKEHGINLQGKPYLISFCSRKLEISTSDVLKLYRTHNIDDYHIDVLLTKKNMRTKLSLYKPSPTVLSIPDDYIHPVEDRTFTVRELARLQSFDDSFIFYGKRTTGGDRRRRDIPQYTQVGNAVPPLMAKAIAHEVMNALKKNNDL